MKFHNNIFYPQYSSHPLHSLVARKLIQNILGGHHLQEKPPSKLSTYIGTLFKSSYIYRLYFLKLVHFFNLLLKVCFKVAKALEIHQIIIIHANICSTYPTTNVHKYGTIHGHESWVVVCRNFLNYMYNIKSNYSL